MTTEIGRVKCWSSTEGLRQKEVLERETGMVYNVKTTTPSATLSGTTRKLNGNPRSVPAVTFALLVELASEAVVRGPADDALLIEGRDDAIGLLLDEGDAVAVVGEVDEGPFELLTPVLLLEITTRPDQVSTRPCSFNTSFCRSSSSAIRNTKTCVLWIRLVACSFRCFKCSPRCLVSLKKP